VSEQDSGRAQAERDEIERTMASAGYRLIIERLQDVRAGKMRKLASDLDLPQTQWIRGFLAGLDCTLAVPGILLDGRPRKTPA